MFITSEKCTFQTNSDFNKRKYSGTKKQICFAGIYKENDSVKTELAYKK